MNEEEYFICHWPRCVLWWCSVTKIGYEVKKIISLQDFSFSCNKSYLAEARKRSYARWRNLDLALLNNSVIYTWLLCGISVKGWRKWICWILIFFHHLSKCNVYSIQKYFNKISFFHFFYHLLIFYLINYWIKKCYVLYMSLYY